MSSKILPSCTTVQDMYDVYDIGAVVLVGASLSYIEGFLAEQQHGTPDLDPREFYPEFHPTDGTCWCGGTAVVSINSVNPRTGEFFQMPRCVSCLAGPDATVF